MQLKNKVAVVTGASRGIGRAIALAYANEGAGIAVVARNRQQLESVAAEIRGCGQRASAFVCDVTDRQSVDQTIDAIADEFGRLDIVVNNAGGGTMRTNVGDDDPNVWRDIIDLNLTSTYYVCRAALTHIRAAGGGTIINVGSGMGHQARASNSSYNVAKAGVWMLTRCLAMEVWDDGITVNELIPGPVATDLTEGMFQLNQPHPKIASEWVKPPEDVGPLALFLASQGPHGPTGQSFSIARRPL